MQLAALSKERILCRYAIPKITGAQSRDTRLSEKTIDIFSREHSLNELKLVPSTIMSNLCSSTALSSLLYTERVFFYVVV